MKAIDNIIIVEGKLTGWTTAAAVSESDRELSQETSIADVREFYVETSSKDPVEIHAAGPGGELLPRAVIVQDDFKKERVSAVLQMPGCEIFAVKGPAGAVVRVYA